MFRLIRRFSKVPAKSKNIEEIPELWRPSKLRKRPKELNAHKPSKILEFDQNKVMLVFSYKNTPFKTLRRLSGALTFTAASIAGLVKTPAFLSSEPLSKPAFLFGAIYGVCKTVASFAKNTLTLSELRLKQDGMHVEIALHSYLGFSSEKSTFTLDIKQLTPPPMYSDSRPLLGDFFPYFVEEFEIESEDPKEPWIKYYDVIRRYMYIHKDFDFMDKELMVAIMSGKYIDTTNI